MDIVSMLLKLVISFLLGGLIGVERQTHGRPAGLRTHILVCMGSTLLTLCSYQIAAGPHLDPGRIAAQIVTGIGFLGAGTIMRQGSVIRGLTTAASVWAIAAVGIAVGIGGNMMYMAIFSSLLIFITLNMVPHMESLIFVRRGQRVLGITTPKDSEVLARIFPVIRKYDPSAVVLGMEESPRHDRNILRFSVHTSRDFDEVSINSELTASEDVISYIWE